MNTMPPQEIDQRVIYGNGGSVRWTFDSTAKLHLVTVYDATGATLGAVETLDGLDAYDYYQHPFSRRQTVDVFTHGPSATPNTDPTTEGGTDDA